MPVFNVVKLGYCLSYKLYSTIRIRSSIIGAGKMIRYFRTLGRSGIHLWKNPVNGLFAFQCCSRSELSTLPSSLIEFYSNPEKQLRVIEEKKHEIMTEDEEIQELIRAIANHTSLESPRLFGPAGIGKPIIGNFPATIHPREHRWEPQPMTWNPYLQERLKANGVKTTTIAFLQNLPYTDATRMGFLLWIKRLQLKYRRKDQSYNAERVRILGPELAVAHFLVMRGGAIKFHGIDRWFSKKEGNADALPGRLVEKAKVEAIDASGMDLIYEGLENFVGMRYLKSLKLHNCLLIDDWCLPKLFILHKTLEHLDISGCHKITHRGLSSLYHLRNLRTLNINDLPKVENKEYIALLLEDELPLCEMIGVEYNQPLLPESEELKRKETLWEKRRIPNPFRTALPEFIEVGTRKYADAINEQFERQLKQLNIDSLKKPQLRKY